MKNKLFLHEEEDLVVVAPQQPEIQQQMAQPKIENKPEENDVDVLSASNLINQMIKGEWDAIDLYNAVIVTIKSNEGGNAHNDEIIKTITDITNEEYIHVGQLEKLLQLINSNANSIENGAAEAENDIANGNNEQQLPQAQAPVTPVQMQ